MTPSAPSRSAGARARRLRTSLPLALLCSALVSFGAALGASAGCSGSKAAPDAGATAATGAGERVHGLTKAQQAETLVKIGDETITVGEFAARLSEQSPYLRARYSSPERRREFLDNMVRFELLAQEAHTKGYDRSDDVERTRKQMMIQAMMKAEFEDRVQLTDITDAEVQTYFAGHRDEFDKPEQVRASHIVLRDRAAAQRVLTQVLAKRADIAFWRQTAERYNEDTETKDRFGDLRFFSRPAQRREDEPIVPAPVAEAAFALAQVGDVHPTLIQSPAGFHILKLTGKRAALHRTLEEASRPIRNRLWRERREQRVTDFIAGLRRAANVTVDEAALATLRVDIPEGDVPELAARGQARPHRPPGGSAGADPGGPGARAAASMKRPALRALALAAALATSAPLGAPRVRADVVERVVAIVDDDAIFLSELRRRAVPFLAQLERVPPLQREAAVTQLYGELLDHLIDEALILQAARKEQIRVTADDVERAISNVRRQSELSDREFWQAVAGQGFTEAQYRDDVRRQLLRLKLLNVRARGRVNITEADVRTRYDQLVREANAQQGFEAAEILVPVPPGASATQIAAARAEAARIAGSLDEDTFEDAMAEYGGTDLGRLVQGQLDPRLERALLAMAPGEVSEPVQNEAGFHILFLRSRVSGAQQIPPYEQAREPLYRRMMEEQMGRQEQLYLRELRRAAAITRRVGPSAG